MARYSSFDPIVALATPWGESAIAVIRVSGKKSLMLLEKVFRGKTPLSSAKGNTVRHGYIHDSKTGEKIDEVVITVYRAPKSYTGEDTAEILCHGSLAIIQKIISLLQSRGFRQAGPGEFTMRAFLNKKMDLTRAEAVNEIIRARTDRARTAALTRLSGSIEHRINQLKQKLLDVLARIEVQLDYPDDEITDSTATDGLTKDAERMIEALLATYTTGKTIQEGITVVIAGGTNAGKSTLFNLFLREDRSIVSEIHGTTRDYIEGAISIEGVPVRLFDTAGIRESENPIEIEGMKRTDRIVKNAHIVLYIVDAKRGLTKEDEEYLASIGKKTKILFLWNKIDASKSPCPEDYIPISAKQGKGIELLNQEIVKTVLGTDHIQTGEPLIDSYRQKELLERALSAIQDFRKGQREQMPLDVISICINDGINALGEITGDVTSQEVLETIFSQFCVGK